MRASLPLVLASVVALAILLGAFSASFYPPQFDETMFAWDAKQIALGRVPYLDFFTFKPPAAIYGAALLFRLAGPTLGSLRVVSVLWLLGVFALLYAAARAAELGHGWAAALALLFPAVLVPIWPLPSTHWFAQGLGMAAFLVATSWKNAPPRTRALAAFAIASSAFLAMQTHGLVATATVTTYFVFEQQRGPAGTRLQAWWVGAIAGWISPIAITMTYLTARGALGRALYDLFVWPARYYRAAGGGPGDGFWGSIAATFSARAGDGDPGLRDTADLGLLGCALLLPPLLLALLASRRDGARAGFAPPPS